MSNVIFINRNMIDKTINTILLAYTEIVYLFYNINTYYLYYSSVT